MFGTVYVIKSGDVILACTTSKVQALAIADSFHVDVEIETYLDRATAGWSERNSQIAEKALSVQA